MQQNNTKIKSNAENKLETFFNMKDIHTLTGHSSVVNSLIQLENGLLASGSADKTIKIWDKDFKCINTLSGHRYNVFSLIQLENGLLASGSEDNTIKIRDKD